MTEAGITPELGTLALEVPRLPAPGFVINTKAEVLNGAVWEPYLAHYDSAPTPAMAMGDFISFGGSFYDK